MIDLLTKIIYTMILARRSGIPQEMILETITTGAEDKPYGDRQHSLKKIAALIYAEQPENLEGISPHEVQLGLSLTISSGMSSAQFERRMGEVEAPSSVAKTMALVFLEVLKLYEEEAAREDDKPLPT